MKIGVEMPSASGVLKDATPTKNYFFFQVENTNFLFDQIDLIKLEKNFECLLFEVLSK